MTGPDRNDFAHAAAQGDGEANLLREWRDFLMHTKKWWLVPVTLALVLLGLLLALSASAAAPFIYTLF
jgi:hypothetical protein